MNDNDLHKSPVLVDRSDARRSLLKFLAGSPLLTETGALGLLASVWAAPPASSFAQSYDVLRAQTRKVGDVIESPEDALNVMDFEPAARKALSAAPAHWGYLATGVVENATLRANQDDYDKLRIKVRRLVDARKIDTRLKLFGMEYASPIFLSPVSSQAAFNPEAETPVARASGATRQLLILSTSSNTSIADVTRAHGRPVWFQLYPTDDWGVTRALIGYPEYRVEPQFNLVERRHHSQSIKKTFRRCGEEEAGLEPLPHRNTQPSGRVLPFQQRPQARFRAANDAVHPRRVGAGATEQKQITAASVAAGPEFALR